MTSSKGNIFDWHIPEARIYEGPVSSAFDWQRKVEDIERTALASSDPEICRTVLFSPLMTSLRVDTASKRSKVGL